MKTQDTKLKWVQRIWLFVFAPLMALVLFGVFYRRGMEGGLLGLWTRPLFKLAAWPLGSVSTKFIWMLLAGWQGSPWIDFFKLMIDPVVGFLQWFLLVPWLFKKWSPEARQRFWLVWFVSIPVSLLVWLVLWLSS